MGTKDDRDSLRLSRNSFTQIVVQKCIKSLLKICAGERSKINSTFYIVMVLYDFVKVPDRIDTFFPFLTLNGNGFIRSGTLIPVTSPGRKQNSHIRAAKVH